MKRKEKSNIIEQLKSHFFDKKMKANKKTDSPAELLKP